MDLKGVIADLDFKAGKPVSIRFEFDSMTSLDEVQLVALRLAKLDISLIAQAVWRQPSLLTDEPAALTPEEAAALFQERAQRGEVEAWWCDGTAHPIVDGELLGRELRDLLEAADDDRLRIVAADARHAPGDLSPLATLREIADSETVPLVNGACFLLRADRIYAVTGCAFTPMEGVESTGRGVGAVIGGYDPDVCADCGQHREVHRYYPDQVAAGADATVEAVETLAAEWLANGADPAAVAGAAAVLAEVASEAPMPKRRGRGAE